MDKQPRISYRDLERWVLFLSFLLSVVVITGFLANRSEAATPGQLAGSESDVRTESRGDEAVAASPVMPQPISLNYYGIFYGPSVGSPTQYQATGNGQVDTNRPLLLKNIVSLSYALTDQLSVAAAGYWMLEPAPERDLWMRDPYVRISHSSIFKTDRLNLYADFRVHFAVSNESRNADLLTGLQSFQILTYTVPDSRWTLATYTSGRLNIYGSQGNGDDVVLYLAPNVTYQASPTLAMTLLYEMGANHQFGDDPFMLSNDGTGLEPGVSWDVTPNLNVNPYLHVYTGQRVSLNTTGFGMTMAWHML